MDGSSTGSFIPKTSVQNSSTARPARRVYILAYIAYLMFFGALIAAGSVYAYTVLLNHKLTTAQTALNTQRHKFNQSDFLKVKREANRLSTASSLLNKHFFVYKIFTNLEKTTVSTVQLTNFTLDSGDKSNTYTLSFDVTAQNMNDLLYQRATYMSDKVLSGAQYSGIELASSRGTAGTGSVSTASFTVTKTFSASDLPLDPALYGILPAGASATNNNSSSSAAVSTGSVASSTAGVVASSTQ